ncbi:MAG: cytochrome-c peroxidase [Azoarcus sp.]|jgi:cytochrome c peroxidase|nr:cytochrome-c peroxidase [Azoarcus sp.]
MLKGQLHFLLYGALALLAAVLVVMLVLPEEEVLYEPDKLTLASQDLQKSKFKWGNGAIPPIPVVSQEELASGKVLLGEKLFHDPKLSADGTISCASCHDIKRGGHDWRRFSVGVGGALGDVNAPTVLNSIFNFRQFWDGRAADLAEQVSGPVLNVAEMASNWKHIIRVVSESSDYQEAFKHEYSGEISERTITDALVRFETTLLTPNSPFDRYLNGDGSALSSDALEGYKRFNNYGCVSCHQGVNLGGNFFQKFGVMGDYFADRGKDIREANKLYSDTADGEKKCRDSAAKADQGRFNVTGDEKDCYVFKVPGLRNVALTAPYFHDGSAATLDQAIVIMGRYQLGRELSEDDRRYLIAFLESLTGEYRGVRLQP